MPAGPRAGRPYNTDATALPPGDTQARIVVADDTTFVEHLGNAGPRSGDWSCLLNSRRRAVAGRRHARIALSGLSVIASDSSTGRRSSRAALSAHRKVAFVGGFRPDHQRTERAVARVRIPRDHDVGRRPAWTALRVRCSCAASGQPSRRPGLAPGVFVEDVGALLDADRADAQPVRAGHDVASRFGRPQNEPSTSWYPSGTAERLRRRCPACCPTLSIVGGQVRRRARLPRAISVPRASRRCSQNRRNGASQVSTPCSGAASSR